jgi:hypothetical protein
MPYTANYNSILDIVELTFTGLITGADLREAASDCTSLQKKTAALRFLVDANGWDTNASVIDILELPAEQYWKEGFDHRTRIAVVLPELTSTQVAARFYEVACQNRGWNARVLPNRHDAILWLSGVTPPEPHDT